MLKASLLVAFSALGILAAIPANGADNAIFSQADLGFTKVEGRDLRTAGLRTGVLVEVLPYLKTGLSVGAVSGTQQASLFDNFLGYDISAELSSSLRIGSWQPFVSLRIPLQSGFTADGSIRDYPTNGSPGSTPSSFTVTDTEGSTRLYGRSGNLTRDFELKGTIQGADIAIGSGFSLTKNLSLTAAAGYSARTLHISSANLENDPWPEVKWGFAERHGLEASDNGDGSVMQPTRKSRFFGGTTLSLGMSYSL